MLEGQQRQPIGFLISGYSFISGLYKENAILLKWISAEATDVGAKRKINEDSILSRVDIGLWVVADGMGGHAAGDMASQAVVNALSQLKPNQDLADFVDAMEDKLLLVNHQLRRHGQEALGGRTLGTTVVSLFFTDTMGACIWAGDSRAYVLRAGQLSRISHDHSAVQEMIDAGMITNEQASYHPHRNVITRAVGGGEKLYPEVRVFTVQAGDWYLLCSDGFYNEVSEDVMTSLIVQETPEESVRILMEKALAHGALDNVSLIIIKVTEA
ncbi:PP2C family protein-serine/threonine phosphatase [Agitococcus lubricus]|uniref:Protein phosphatase n=1 Tax=Agitococcus lubricus TaxID=1077255 RepID=A0A2T5IYI5_9GAMM|nr:protein phosphatase 2C domain-containing protein [Agitococcus lubricus]PTQ89069.1 protein phosphatase [Agitococcus lubricus]